MFKTWLDAQEIRALICTLERAAVMLDEYAEGTLDLKHELSEDLDARLFVATEPVMYPTIDGMFDMTEVIKKENEDDD